MLKVKNLSVHYGMIQAIKDISFEVNEGEIVTLIGANGAGKSTILRTISGLVKPSSGEIEYLGKPIHNVATRKIVEQGIAQVPEGRHVFKGLTVQENLDLGSFTRKDKQNFAGIWRRYSNVSRFCAKEKIRMQPLCRAENNRCWRWAVL